jgi:hypothetical protein
LEAAFFLNNEPVGVSLFIADLMTCQEDQVLKTKILKTALYGELVYNR